MRLLRYCNCTERARSEHYAFRNDKIDRQPHAGDPDLSLYLYAMSTVDHLSFRSSRLPFEQVRLRFRAFHTKLRRPSRPAMYVGRTNLLILGAARSGTTLLAAMLASHSQASVLFEDVWGGAGRILAKRYKGVKLCIPKQIELQHHWSLLDLVLARIPKLKNVPPLFKTATSKYSIEDYLLNEDLKIVAIVRDAKSATSSMQKWSELPDKVAMSDWSRAVEVMHGLYEKNKGRMIVVHFNSLVTAPEQTARALCDFLDVEYEPNMLQAHRHTPIYETNKIDALKAVSDETAGISDEAVKRQYESLLRQSI